MTVTVWNVLFNTLTPHTTIKVEAKWDLHEVPHLDTVIYKGPDFESMGRLSSTVYHKPTDVHPLLHSTSNHPPHPTHNIAFAQALRYQKICSEPAEYERQIKLLDRLHKKLAAG